MNGEYSIYIVQLPIGSNNQTWVGSKPKDEIYPVAGYIPNFSAHGYIAFFRPDGSLFSEMHGLATDPKTGKSVPIGFSNEILRFKEIPSNAFGDMNSKYYENNRIKIFSGDKEAFDDIHAKMLLAGKMINNLQLKYPSLGLGANSNSVASTLLKAAGLSEPDFQNFILPGKGVNLLGESITNAILNGEITEPVFDFSFFHVPEEFLDNFSLPKGWYPLFPPLPRDPLSLDLNGDGEVSTISKDRGVYFDLDNSGFAERTAWIAPEDGLLVLDHNGNGQIDGGAELFGTETLLADGSFAANGFEALKEFDTNSDGVIDANDAVFADLRVWQDGNSDGLVQGGELKTLADLGITAIGTDYRRDGVFTDQQGVEHREFGEFIRAGAGGAVHTLWFDSDTVQSVPVDVHQGAAIAIADEIAALPDAVGFGNVYSLHEAMQRDSSGELQMLVQAFVAEHDAARRHDFAEKLLQAWAGTAEVNPAGRGGYVDARHVETMERFWGQEALQKNPAGRYAASVEAAYQELLGYTYAQLALQSHFKTAWNTVRFDTDGAADFSVTAAYFAARFAKGDAAAADALSDFLSVLAGITPDSSSLHDGFKAAAEAQALELPFALREAMLQALHTGDDVLNAAEQQHYVDADAGDDRVTGSAEGDALFGGAGRDYIDGQDGHDLLDGGAGDDSLHGGSGNDVLIGGAGADRLDGGAGDDIYLYRAGDGSDVIANQGGGADTLVFTDIASTAVLVSRQDADLHLHLPDEAVITVQGYFNDEGVSSRALSHIRFADDVQWDTQAVQELVLHPVLENSRLYGYGGDDVLQGGDGKDYLFGNAGADTLIGGRGNDTLNGGDGGDVYVYTLGDGQDVIKNSGDAAAVDTLQLQGITA